MAANHRAWSVPVRLEDVPETGRRFDLRADAAACVAVARIAGIPGIAKLEAAFDVTRQGPDRLRVIGEVSATVRQTCVVTLEPVTNEIQESVDLVFAGEKPRRDPAWSEGDIAPERPEPLVNGTVDLGAIAAEFLILGIDPYPRKAGAVFHLPAGEDNDTGPFAELAALKKKSAGTEG